MVTRRACLLCLVLFCGVGAGGPGLAPSGEDVEVGPPPPTSICLFDLFELRVDQVPTINGPFDSRRTPLATFSSGSTNVTVRSFVYQNFTRAWVGDREQLTPVGETVFLVRFAPPTLGL